MGAGCSVSAGIPDFRTPGTGLYSQVQKYNLPYAEAIFDLHYFNNVDRKPFHRIAKEMYPDPAEFKPTTAHKFVKLLHEKVRARSERRGRDRPCAPSPYPLHTQTHPRASS